MSKSVIKPIVDHLKLDGGYLFVNQPWAASVDQPRKKQDESLAFKNYLHDLDQMLSALGKKLNIRFIQQPQIDVSNFTMHPAYLLESREGVVYKAEITCPKRDHRAHPFNSASKPTVRQIPRSL